MKIIFNKVIIDNSLSFGHAEVDLRDMGYTLVEGINNNPLDGAKSNGSGKSSIFNAICYALTGETIQGLTSNLNNIVTNEPMSVQLDFNVDADNFLLIRGRDTKNHADLKIFVNGIDKSGKGIRESQEILNNYLPDLTSDLIGEVIIVGQGMPHKFSNNTPSGRKDLLEKLSHSDYMLEDIKTRVENRSNTLKNKKEDLIINKTKKETNKELLQRSIELKEKELLNYENKPKFDEQINELKQTIEDKQILNNQLLQDIEAINKEIEDVNQNIINLSNEKNIQLESEFNVFSDHNTEIKSDIVNKRTLKQKLTEDINKLKQIKDVCPTCGQKIPHVHKPDTSNQEKELDQLDSDLKVLLEKDKNQEDAYKLNIKDIKDSFKQKENELTETKNNLKTKYNNLTNLQNQTNNSINQYTIQLNKVIQDRDNFDKERELCVQYLNDSKAALSVLNNDILYIIKEEEEVNKHQEVINKMSTLIKRDFRGILLSSIIKYIDNKCKVYSKDIFGTEELDFKLDGNNINITYLNKPLEALSGGEQQKVDLILQFAIRSMMQEYTGFTSNIIVLDEILDNLDSVGCDSVLNFITNRLSDIESIFIISHHADTLNIGNDSTITVVKNKEGVSYII